MGADKIKWGIIGCGDVCEIKSGPAFNKVNNSELVAVMRRNPAKAEDFARRHGVPKFYSEVDDLLNDTEINAIYVATPPSTHEEMAIKAMDSGRNVYIEKPIALDTESARRIHDASLKYRVKATGAYYRRCLPQFEKIKELIQGGALGKISEISIRLALPIKSDTVASSDENWRWNPLISGGGLFYDLAPHMLDIVYWIFGKSDQITGFSINQSLKFEADDFTTLTARFQSDLVLNGVWSFNVNPINEDDSCRIFGEKGFLEFSFFEMSKLKIYSERTQQFEFTNPENIQLPMISKTVDYFLGIGDNPCSIEETLVSMEMMDVVSKS